MVAQSQLGSTFVVKSYLFQATDVTDAAGTMTIPGSAGQAYPLPFGGSVLGVTFRGSGTVGGTLTTGTLTPVVMINGATISSFSNPPTIMVSTPGGSFMQEGRAPGFTFVKDATLGLTYTKAGTVAPTGVLDVTAEVWVLHEEVRY